MRHKRRRKQAVITRHLVPLSGQEPGSVDVGSHERSRVMLEQAFDDGNMNANGDILSLVPCGHLIS